MADLTAEQVVTELLSSNEILRKSKDKFYMSSTNSLGDFLKNLPENNEAVERLANNKKVSKYSFIKNKWEV